MPAKLRDLRKRVPLQPLLRKDVASNGPAWPPLVWVLGAIATVAYADHLVVSISLAYLYIRPLGVGAIFLRREISYCLIAICILFHDYYSPRNINPGAPDLRQSLSALLCFTFVVYFIQRPRSKHAGDGGTVEHGNPLRLGCQPLRDVAARRNRCTQTDTSLCQLRAQSSASVSGTDGHGHAHEFVLSAHRNVSWRNMRTDFDRPHPWRRASFLYRWRHGGTEPAWRRIRHGAPFRHITTRFFTARERAYDRYLEHRGTFLQRGCFNDDVTILVVKCDFDGSSTL